MINERLEPDEMIFDGKGENCQRMIFSGQMRREDVFDIFKGQAADQRVVEQIFRIIPVGERVLQGGEKEQKGDHHDSQKQEFGF